MNHPLKLKGALSILLGIVLALLLVVACNETSSGETIDPPSNVTITAQEGAILITWQDNSDNEIGFAIFRKTTNSAAQAVNGYTQIATAPANVEHHIDEEVNPDVQYQYQLGVLGANGIVGSTVIPTVNDPISPMPDASFYGESVRIFSTQKLPWWESSCSCRP